MRYRRRLIFLSPLATSSPSPPSPSQPTKYPTTPPPSPCRRCSYPSPSPAVPHTPSSSSSPHLIFIIHADVPRRKRGKEERREWRWGREWRQIVDVEAEVIYHAHMFITRWKPADRRWFNGKKMCSFFSDAHITGGETIFGRSTKFHNSPGCNKNRD